MTGTTREAVETMRTAEPITAEALLLELRELAQDVSGDARIRARRLALLRRYERHEARMGRPVGAANA